MARWFPYRYLIVGMASVGVFILTSYRIVFIYVVTHTTKKNVSEFGHTTFYSGCTSYNTSTDYTSDYGQDTDMEFQAIYFFSMFLAMMASGLITTRFKCNRIITFSAFFASLLFLIIPPVFKVSLQGVLAVRFLEGLLEAIIQPALVVWVTAWTKTEERSMFLSICLIGMYLSPGTTSISVGACLCYVSWDSAIYIYGTLGIIWSLVWAKFSYPQPQQCPSIESEELEEFTKDSDNLKTGSTHLAKSVPWKSILTSKAVWAIWFACFCRNFVVSIVQALQPLFFLDVFGIRAADSGLLQTIPFFFNAFFVFFFSYIADRLIASRRFSVTAVRKFMQCVGIFLEAFFFGCMTYATSWQMSFFFLTTAYAFGGMTFAGYTCNMVDLSPKYSGVVSAVATTGVVGGAVSPFIASFILADSNNKEKWGIFFWLAAVIASLAGVFYFLFASGEKQDWSEGHDPFYEAITDGEKVDKENNKETSLLN